MAEAVSGGKEDGRLRNWKTLKWSKKRRTLAGNGGRATGEIDPNLIAGPRRVRDLVKSVAALAAADRRRSLARPPIRTLPRPPCASKRRACAVSATAARRRRVWNGSAILPIGHKAVEGLHHGQEAAWPARQQHAGRVLEGARTKVLVVGRFGQPGGFRPLGERRQSRLAPASSWACESCR